MSAHSIAVTGLQNLRLSAMQWRWIGIATVAMLDGMLLAATGITLSPGLLASYAEVALLWGLVTLSSFVYAYLRKDGRLAAMMLTVLQASAFSLAAAIFSYLVLTFQAPLADQEFSAIDAMLGLDWMGWFRWVDAHRGIRSLLIAAYESVPAQLGLAVVLLPWIGRQRYVSEFCTAAMVALLVIIPISGLVPALGPWVDFGIGIVEADWLPDVLAMHSGGMRVIGEHPLHGVVEFPSFHTALAILLVSIMRWNRFALALSACLNGLMILSVPTVGGHYFIDVLAGAVVALFAIIVARRIEGPAYDDFAADRVSLPVAIGDRL